MSALTLGSLFDGIGGFPLGCVHNGITPVWASEIEPFPIAVTKQRFPEMVHVGDITKLDGAVLPPVDIIAGGSPCQDLSVAGKRAGLAGQRSGLFMDQMRIVKEMRKADEQRGTPTHLVRPRYCIWENVPGAFSSANGEDFRAVIEEIVRVKDSSRDVPRPDFGLWQPAGAVILGDEFSLAWRTIDAQFWGVAQRRRRIYLVADFAGGTAPQILFEQDSLCGDTTQGGGTWQGITATAAGCTDDTGRTCVAPFHSFHVNQRDEVIETQGVTGALLATQNMQMQTFIAQEPVLCLNDQGGNQMHCTENLVGTLRAQEHGHQPLVFDNHGKDCRYTGPLTVAPTLASAMGTGGNNVPLVGNPIAFSFDALASNSMQSDNPHSGCHETQISRTLDTTCPEPSKNQGGLAILQESYCIAGNIIDRQDKNGGNGLGCQQDISYTLTGADRHAVFSMQRSSEYTENDVVCTQAARQCKDATDLVIQSEDAPIMFGQSQFGTYAEGCSTLCAQGGNNGGGSENLITVPHNTNRKLVRRLTPLECERLQGFPDGWTDIHGASDSARYKALGNSVAIPCVDFVLRGIAFCLRQIYEQENAECTTTPKT